MESKLDAKKGKNNWKKLNSKGDAKLGVKKKQKRMQI